MNHRLSIFLTVERVPAIAMAAFLLITSTTTAAEPDAVQPSATAKGPTELSLEDLVNITVTSVSKKATRLEDSPAAVAVITQDDIRRLGVTSIPEALRMSPGLDVARINGNEW